MSFTAPEPTLEDRVADLEAQLADVRATDNIQPNYLTVNPDGTVGALFTGGVQLDEAVISQVGQAPQSPYPNSLSWLRADGSVSQQIDGERSVLNPLNPSESLILRALQDAGGHTVRVRSDLFDSAGNLLEQFLLGDSTGKSSFLQLIAADQRAADFGAGSLTFSASGAANATVNHGIGRTPQIVVATAQGVIGSLVMHADTFTSTTFRAVGALTPSGSGTFTFYWLAIG